MRSIAVALGLALGAVMGTSAASPLKNPEITACVPQAAKAFGVPQEVIEVVLEVEGGWPGAEIKNTNGSHDLGPMQINTQWIPRLSEFGVSREDVRDNPCVNVSVGTWLLASELEQGRTLAEAIARYHSPTRHHQVRYLNKVAEVLERRLLTAGGG